MNGQAVLELYAVANTRESAVLDTLRRRARQVAQERGRREEGIAR